MSQHVLTEPMAADAARGDKTRVALTTFLNLFSLVGLSFYGLPFFYDFMVREFGWTRATVTSGNAFGKIVIGPLFGFIAGWFIDRFGPRKLMVAGVLMAGASLMGLGSMTALWMFYVCYLFNALGYVTGGPLPNQVLLSRWFDRDRGKAMGFAYIGIGVGGMLVPQLARFMESQFGWRQALILLGVLMIMVALPMILMVNDKPPGFTETAAAAPPVPISQVLRQPAFYLLAIGSMCSIGAVGGTNQHLKLFLGLDLKYSQGMAANIISLVLASSIFGRLLMGWLADRFPRKYVMLLIYVLVSAAIPLLYFVSAPGVIYVFAVVFGIAFGGDYMIIPLMAADLFGVRVLGRVMGIIITADGVAEALAPMLVGRLYDLNGNYVNGFAALIGRAIVGAMAISLLPQRKIAE